MRVPPTQTDWTQRVAQGLVPAAADLRDHLRQVHHDHAGFTESCASGCHDESGRTSYEWLAEVVDPAKHRSVLDLACGSGPLLELCHQRFSEELILTGVDMVPEELALARARLPAGRVRLIQAQAQNLNMIPGASIDVALCHWALTLMDPVAPVLAEMARVLAPGGRFAAIVDGPMDTAPGYAKVHDLVYGHVQAELPGYGDVDLGDPRIRDTKSLLALVRAAFPEEASVEVQSNLVTMEGPANQVAANVAGFFYAAFVLSADRRAAMLADLANLVSEMNTVAAYGKFIMPINRIVVTLG